MLLTLPLEALDRIVQCQYDVEDLKALRATCKILNELATPSVFTHLAVDFQDDYRSSTVDMLRDIASKKTIVGGYFQSLEIRSLTLPSKLWQRMIWGSTQLSEEDAMIAAIPDFVFLTSVSICLNGIKALPIPSQDAILRRIAALPRLSHLSLDVGDFRREYLLLTSHFRNLCSLHFSVAPDKTLFQTIVSQSPNLATLSIDGVYSLHDSKHGGVGPSLAGLLMGIPTLKLENLSLGGKMFDDVYLARRHLSSLTTLLIHPEADASLVPPELWGILRADGVRLRKLTCTLHQGDDTLYEYLQSYSGLVELDVDLTVGARGWVGKDADLVAGVFWVCVVAKHAGSLGRLAVRAKEGGYCLTDGAMDVLLTCMGLRELSVCVGLREAQAPFHRNVVTRLLNHVAHGRLPRLRKLDLSLAGRQSSSNSESLYSYRAVRKHAMINEVVRKYSCADPSPVMLGLELSTGYMRSNVLVKNKLDGKWYFEIH